MGESCKNCLRGHLDLQCTYRWVQVLSGPHHQQREQGCVVYGGGMWFGSHKRRSFQYIFHKGLALQNPRKAAWKSGERPRKDANFPGKPKWYPEVFEEGQTLRETTWFISPDHKALFLGLAGNGWPWYIYILNIGWFPASYVYWTCTSVANLKWLFSGPNSIELIRRNLDEVT